MTTPKTLSAGKKTRSAEAMWMKTVLIVIATLLASAIWSDDGRAAGSRDAESLVASIDAGRMMETIEELEAFWSREFHLESFRDAGQYLLDEFEEMGVSAEAQELMVGDATVSNIVATLPGTDETAGAYLFGAHYDSENYGATTLSTAENLSAPGADDDASGAAAVLEIARVLKGSGFPATVKFVLFAAEERGYDGSGGAKGSEFFVASEIEAGQTYAATVIMDMIAYRAGDTNKAVIIVQDDEFPLAGPTADAVDEFGIDLSLDIMERPDLRYSDHSSFWEEGIPSMLVIEEIGGTYDYPVNPLYHSSIDISLFLSEEQLEAVTQAVLGGLLLTWHEDGWSMLVFGAAIILVATVSVALFVRFHWRRGRDRDDS